MTETEFELEILEMRIESDYNDTRNIKYPHDALLDKSTELAALSSTVVTYNIKDKEHDHADSE